MSDLKMERPEEIVCTRRPDGLVEVRFKLKGAEAHFTIAGAAGCTSTEPGRIDFVTTEGALVQLNLLAMMKLYRPSEFKPIRREARQ